MDENNPISPEDLQAVPVFPLPGTVLMPRTFISLHVFEPRYRVMMEACIEGPRMMAIAMLDDRSAPDEHGRPAIHRVAGLGALQRAVKLPDGRYSLVLEGVARVDLSDELPPDQVFRRARGRLLEDRLPDADINREMASLRALALRALAQIGPEHKELLNGLGDVSEPGALADIVAAALVENARDRQRILEAVDVDLRIELTAGFVGALLLDDDPPEGAPTIRWGIAPGKA